VGGGGRNLLVIHSYPPFLPSLPPSLPPGLSDLRKQCGEDVGLTEKDRIPFSTTFSGVARIKYGTFLPPSLPPSGCLKGFLGYNHRNKKRDVLPFMDTKQTPPSLPPSFRPHQLLLLLLLLLLRHPSLPPSLPFSGCLKGFLGYNHQNKKRDVLPFMDTKHVTAADSGKNASFEIKAGRKGIDVRPSLPPSLPSLPPSCCVVVFLCLYVCPFPPPYLPPSLPPSGFLVAPPLDRQRAHRVKRPPKYISHSPPPSPPSLPPSPSSRVPGGSCPGPATRPSS